MTPSHQTPPVPQQLGDAGDRRQPALSRIALRSAELGQGLSARGTRRMQDLLEDTRLRQKVLEGGAGNWGQSPMPPQSAQPRDSSRAQRSGSAAARSAANSRPAPCPSPAR